MSFAPRWSPHNCTVHHCTLDLPNDPMRGRLGHLQPIGFQSATFPNATQLLCEEVRSLSRKRRARLLWRESIAPKQPVHLRACDPPHAAWSSDAALSALDPDWPVIVEEQNRVTHTHRHPFHANWTFATFLRRYRTRSLHNAHYMITALRPHSKLHGLLLDVESSTSCPEWAFATRDTRVWMSDGNTSSSLHFDTHDAVVMQMHGTKHWVLYHPRLAPQVYMNDAARYGLSPINTDRVDLHMFPEFASAHAEHVLMVPGDVLYLPALVWHVVHTPPGRNIAVVRESEHRQQVRRTRRVHSPQDAFLHAYEYTLAHRPRELRCTRGDIDRSH